MGYFNNHLLNENHSCNYQFSFFKGTVAQWVEHYIIKVKEDLLQNSRNAPFDIHSLPLTF